MYIYISLYYKKTQILPVLEVFSEQSYITSLPNSFAHLVNAIVQSRCRKESNGFQIHHAISLAHVSLTLK